MQHYNINTRAVLQGVFQARHTILKGDTPALMRRQQLLHSHSSTFQSTSYKMNLELCTSLHDTTGEKTHKCQNDTQRTQRFFNVDPPRNNEFTVTTQNWYTRSVGLSMQKTNNESLIKHLPRKYTVQLGNAIIYTVYFCHLRYKK